MTSHEKTLEFTSGETSYSVTFYLIKASHCLVDDLQIKMHLIGKDPELQREYTTKMKVFSNPGGVSNISSLESIIKTICGYAIKFYYSGMLMEGELTEDDKEFDKRLPMLHDFDVRLESLTSQVNELRNIIMTMKNNNNNYNKEGDDEGKSPSTSPIKSLNDSDVNMKNITEQMNDFSNKMNNTHEAIDVMRNAMMKIESRVVELEEKTKSSKLLISFDNENVNKTQENGTLEERIHLCEEMNKAKMNEMAELKREVSSSFVVYENKQQTLLNDMNDMKNWSTQTDSIIFNLKKTISTMATSPRNSGKQVSITVSTPKDNTFASLSDSSPKLTDSSRSSTEIPKESPRSVTRKSALDSPRDKKEKKEKKDKKEKKEKQKSRRKSEERDEPKRKKLHGKNKDKVSKTLKEKENR
ncbi:hypothetical protein QTN25_002749 [Entamoeba marina]